MRDDEKRLDAHEVARVTRLDVTLVWHYAELGLITPSEEGYTQAEVAELRRVRRLHEELGLDYAAIEIVSPDVPSDSGALGRDPAIGIREDPGPRRARLDGRRVGGVIVEWKKDSAWRRADCRQRLAQRFLVQPWRARKSRSS